jgi:hypothetical protein
MADPKPNPSPPPVAPPATPPLNPPQPDHAALAAASAATAAAVEDRRKRNTKSVEDRSAAMEASNREAMRRMDASKPTPTQRENDLAKVGALNVDEKEDHGGEDEQVAMRRTMEAKLSGQPYYTRDANPDRPEKK